MVVKDYLTILVASSSNSGFCYTGLHLRRRNEWILKTAIYKHDAPWKSFFSNMKHTGWRKKKSFTRAELKPANGLVDLGLGKSARNVAKIENKKNIRRFEYV